MSYDYDLLTLGAGSGGVRASRVSASMGARVAVIEERDLGGTCVNVGCVPKKLMYYASHFAEEFEDSAGFGWTVPERRFDWPTFLENKDNEISRLNGIYRNLLEGAGVEIVEGTARLVGPHEVQVSGRTLTAKNILIAVGGWPVLPEIPGAELAKTSNEVFAFEQLPERLLIVGGGYIAVEFAGVFAGLGTEVTLVHRGDQVLRGFDEDLRLALRQELEHKGIDLRLDSVVTGLAPAGSGVRATLETRAEDGTTESECEADHAVFAIGRRPLTANLGLEAAGVEVGAGGEVLIDEYRRTNVEHIYAIGDVTDKLNLTPTAIREGMAISETLFGSGATVPDLENVPTAVFSQPPIGTVGLTEAEAREQHSNVKVYKSQFRILKHTLTPNPEKTLLKLIVAGEDEVVVGAHMLGPEAGEIVQGIAIAVKLGATKAQFDATVGIHPTTAEEFVTMR